MQGGQRLSESSEIGADFACSATTGRTTDELRSQADSRRRTALDPAFQEVLTPVKSGDRRGRIKVRGICARDFGTLFLDLEMAEQGGRTQRSGEYCRMLSRWILGTWNGETLSIIGTVGWISVTSRFPRLSTSWSTHRSRKESTDLGEVISQSSSRSLIELGVENNFSKKVFLHNFSLFSETRFVSYNAPLQRTPIRVGARTSRPRS